jgi:hypothetical protein
MLASDKGLYWLANFGKTLSPFSLKPASGAFGRFRRPTMVRVNNAIGKWCAGTVGKGGGLQPDHAQTIVKITRLCGNRAPETSVFCWLDNLWWIMRKKLDWVEILNEQQAWTSRDEFKQWFYALAGRQANLLDGTIDGFIEALGFMRRQVANLHFSEPVDLLWLDTQLKTVTLGLLHHQGAQEGAESKLPRFRARVKGMLDSDLLRAVKDSLLIQFAEYVGNALDGTADKVVSRCEGLKRKTTLRALPPEATCGEEGEQRWREELPLLRRNTPATADLERCPNLFAGTSKTKFCSDTCRFATFQISKQVEEPGYLAAKQRRYRRRQEKQAE